MSSFFDFSKVGVLFNSYFVKHGLISLFGRFISMPLAVCFNITIAKSLSVADYGLIGLMTTIIIFAQTISMFGYREILIKYLPFNFKNKKYYEFGSLIYTSFAVSILFTLIIITLLNLFSNEISTLYKHQGLKLIIPFFSLNLFFTILCLNSNSILISLKKVWQSNFSERTIMNVFNCFQLFILYWFNITIDLLNVSIILIIGKLMSLLFSFFYSKKYFKFINYRKLLFNENLKTSVHLLFSELSLKIVAIVSPLIIGLYLNSEEVGFFYTAFLLANFTSFFISISNNLLSNKVSNLFHSDEYIKLIEINKKTSIYLGVLGVCILIFYVFFGKLVLSLWGEQYIYNSFVVLLILTFGEMINCFGGCSGIIISICDLEKKGMYIAYGCSILNIILQITLIPKFGIIGAAISTSLSVVIYNLLKQRIVYISLRQ